MKEKNTIETKLGTFSKAKFKALTNLRANALLSFRETLRKKGFTEVTTASLVNIAGSCENPYASFTLNYYGREAHLSQSAQLQLEALVIRLKQGFFTVNNSFREENFDDPKANNRRLSEFTLIEPEKPFHGKSPSKALLKLIKLEEEVVKEVVQELLLKNRSDIRLLGGNVGYLQEIAKIKFNIISYEEVLEILNRELKPKKKFSFGVDLGIREEQFILKFFNDQPTFITHLPAAIKFFNMKRDKSGQRTFSVDLLLPRLGETIGGAIREEDGEKIKDYLLKSNVGKFIKDKGGDPLVPFTEYFNLFKTEKPILRGGFGIGFERFIGFIIDSNDILSTITDTGITAKTK